MQSVDSNKKEKSNDNAKQKVQVWDGEDLTSKTQEEL